MAYHDELLEHAYELLLKDPNRQSQADLRRAVSAAYYALFHMLISETVAHWSLATSRNGLARMFEHHLMVKASARVADSKIFPFTGHEPAVVQKLRTVAQALVQLQEQRTKADYDNATLWTRTEAVGALKIALGAVENWDSIRDEPIAQEYLVSLLIKSR